MLDVEKDRLEISRGSTSEAGELVQTVSVSIREESTVSWSIQITTYDPSYINAALQVLFESGLIDPDQFDVKMSDLSCLLAVFPIKNI